jgi:hypothetical protein
MKFLVFLLTVVALTWCVGAQPEACKSNSPCTCEGVDNENKRLITCSGSDRTIIYLNDLGITSVNANAFDNNTNMTHL